MASQPPHPDTPAPEPVDDPMPSPVDPDPGTPSDGGEDESSTEKEGDDRHLHEDQKSRRLTSE